MCPVPWLAGFDGSAAVITLGGGTLGLGLPASVTAGPPARLDDCCRLGGLELL